jgi:exodeoxyribonuclease V alpha subunit
MDLHPTQQAAVDAATSSRFAIINGGAGTGKTTLIAAIARQLGPSTALCAFAGKAAARLRDATGRDASTIHRLLMYDGSSFNCRSLAGQTVVIDEASMVSSDLLAAVMERSPARLILVGDEAQLPPVGSGQPFHDLITLRPDLVTNLTKCWRASEAVFRAGIAIRNGEAPAQYETTANESWQVKQTGGPVDTHAAILDAVRAGYLDFSGGTDIILAPRNGTPDDPCTVNGLNASIVAIVNPRPAGAPDATLLPGDRVMNTKNNSEADVWNGTTGTVHAIDTDGQAWVELDLPRTDGSTRCLFTAKMRKKLVLAYALTVHKSQGSQFRRVMFACTAKDAHNNSRAKVYTAVTRTTAECTVIGDRGAMAAAIRNTRTKRTVIQELAKA